MLLGKKPVQGIWGLVVKMMEKYGSLNRKYDSQLRGIVDNADKVDGHDAGTAAGNVLVLDTAGQVPLANLPLLPASQLGFSFAWEKVAEISETGVSSIEFTGLAGDTDKLYYIIIATANPNASMPGIHAIFNNDNNIGNYFSILWYNRASTTNTTIQYFGATSGTAGAILAVAGENAVSIFSGIIFACGKTVGTKTYVPVVSTGVQTDYQLDFCGGAWKKSSEVESITLITQAGVDIDWEVYLFKPKW